jgi:predicted nucleic acid-binding protein
MIVVADTSPLNYLIQIDCIEVLPALYGEVFIPHEVHHELLASGAPLKVQSWALNSPGWLQIRSALSADRPELRVLDSGEQAAIYLALELNADQLLLDESKARHIATSLLNVEVAGTLRVLRDAHYAKLLDAYEAFERLRSHTNFYLTPKLTAMFLQSIS